MLQQKKKHNKSSDPWTKELERHQSLNVVFTGHFVWDGEAKSVNRSILKKSRHIGFGVFIVHSSMLRPQIYRRFKTNDCGWVDPVVPVG
jgi:hypothetical protein